MRQGGQLPQRTVFRGLRVPGPRRLKLMRGRSSLIATKRPTVVCAHVFTARVRTMGIRDRPIAPGSPWQNGCSERLIGTCAASACAPAANSFRLCGILQSSAHALGITARCPSCGSGRGRHGQGSTAVPHRYPSPCNVTVGLVNYSSGLPGRPMTAKRARQLKEYCSSGSRACRVNRDSSYGSFAIRSRISWAVSWAQKLEPGELKYNLLTNCTYLASLPGSD